MKRPGVCVRSLGIVGFRDLHGGVRVPIVEGEGDEGPDC